jgi:hypothetical protein
MEKLTIALSDYERLKMEVNLLITKIDKPFPLHFDHIKYDCIHRTVKSLTGVLDGCDDKQREARPFASSYLSHLDEIYKKLIDMTIEKQF